MYEKVSKACSGDRIKHKMAAGKVSAADSRLIPASFETYSFRIMFLTSSSQIRLILSDCDSGGRMSCPVTQGQRFKTCALSVYLCVFRQDT